MHQRSLKCIELGLNTASSGEMLDFSNFPSLEELSMSSHNFMGCATPSNAVKKLAPNLQCLKLDFTKRYLKFGEDHVKWVQNFARILNTNYPQSKLKKVIIKDKYVCRPGQSYEIAPGIPAFKRWPWVYLEEARQRATHHRLTLEYKALYTKEEWDEIISDNDRFADVTGNSYENEEWREQEYWDEIEKLSKPSVHKGFNRLVKEPFRDDRYVWVNVSKTFHSNGPDTTCVPNQIPHFLRDFEMVFLECHNSSQPFASAIQAVGQDLFGQGNKINLFEQQNCQGGAGVGDLSNNQLCLPNGDSAWLSFMVSSPPPPPPPPPPVCNQTIPPISSESNGDGDGHQWLSIMVASPLPPTSAFIFKVVTPAASSPPPPPSYEPLQAPILGDSKITLKLSNGGCCHSFETITVVDLSNNAVCDTISLVNSFWFQGTANPQDPPPPPPPPPPPSGGLWNLQVWTDDDCGNAGGSPVSFGGEAYCLQPYSQTPTSRELGHCIHGIYIATSAISHRLVKDTHLDESTNPVDQQVLSYIWRKLWKPPEQWGGPLKDAVLAMSDTQIVAGLSILASGFSQVGCGLSIFHWHIVVFLAWFSSVTHLTTLTFLRRYIHDNRGIRMLRLVLMLLLVVILAVALVPTGGACGLQDARQYNYTRTTAPYGSNIPYWSFTPEAAGSPAKCCFSEMPKKETFIGPDNTDFLSMIASEVVLISSSFTKALKLFRGSSNFAKAWLRHKPAQTCKRLARNLEDRFNNPKLIPKQRIYFVCHCILITFIVFARAVYDLAESMLWKMSWLLFSLAWGTVRIFNIRNLADSNVAAVDDSQREVVLQENFWGFGQLVPTLLLILPLLSLAEGVLGLGKPKSTNTASASSNPVTEEATTEDNTTAVAVEAPDSNRSSLTMQPSQNLPLYTDPYTELERTTDFEMTRRTGTDLVNMEYNLGSNAENAPSIVTRRHSRSPQGNPPSETSPPQSTIQLWPAEALYNHDFYTDEWYIDMVICMFLLALELGIELIAFTAGVGSKTVITFIANFESWQIYISITLLFSYAIGFS
ncbi:hypothetical protein B7463_g9794, partial [Scytalidium lignicola]